MPSHQKIAKSILILAGDDYEDLELWYPKLRLVEAGCTVTVAGQGPPGTTYLGKHGYPCVSDAQLPSLDLSAMDGIILPGGWMPDKLRRDPVVLNAVRSFHQNGRMIAAICHGGWIAISAGVYVGARVTGSLGIKDDLVNAGAIWEDAAVVVDRHLISSRKPADLPRFAAAILDFLVH